MNSETKLLPKPGCANCEAVCCRDIHLPLDDSEARKLRRKGTKLVFVGRPNSRGRDVRAVYKMEGECGYVEYRNGMRACGIHGDGQPAICKGFTEGGQTCLELRSKRIGRDE